MNFNHVAVFGLPLSLALWYLGFKAYQGLVFLMAWVAA